MLAYGHDAQLLGAFIETLKTHSQHTPLAYSPTEVNEWVEASRLFANSHVATHRTLADEVNTLLTAQNIAPDEDYRKSVFKKMDYSPELGKQKSMAAALAWTTQNLIAFDALEAQQKQKLADAFADDLLLTTMLGHLSYEASVIV
jgi:hypothetical protein